MFKNSNISVDENELIMVEEYEYLEKASELYSQLSNGNEKKYSISLLKNALFTIKFKFFNFNNYFIQ